MKPYFELGELRRPDPIKNCSEKLSEQFFICHEHKVSSIKELIGHPPTPGEAIFIWTDKSFNAFTFIPFSIKEYGKIDRLILSTYSINNRIIDSLMRYIDKGKILSVDIFISETIRHRLPRAVDQIEAIVRSRPEIIRVGYGWNHSKVTLINAGGQHFVVEGSGNWSENARNEQYIFLNSHQVYEFRAKYILNAIKSDTRAAGTG